MAIPHLSYANEALCFDKPVAERILIDLKTCKSDKELLYESIDKYKEKVNGLELDKEEYKKQKDLYKDLYLKENEALTKEKESKPSRLVWFGTGVTTTLVIILIGLFTVK